MHTIFGWLKQGLRYRNGWPFMIVTLLLMGSLYQYHKIYHLRPQSLHQWRQTDCLAISRNFYDHGMKLMEPEINTLISDDDTSGKSAGEFPIYYYLMAGFWKVFGVSEGLYRLLTWLLFGFALVCFQKTLFQFLSDAFWSWIAAVWMFTSPILAFYAFNFLTNVPAFSLVFIGGWLVMKYYNTEKIKWLWWACFMFALAGLLKVTALILPITLMGLLLLEWMGFNLGAEKKIFKNSFKSFLPFLLIPLSVGGWFIYAKYYNDLHGGKYTFNHVWPIWEVTPDQMKGIVKFMREALLNQIFSNTTVYLLAGLLITLILNLKKLKAGMILALISVIVGCTAYMMLWFQAFDAHDYYLINVFILPAAIFLSFLTFLKREYPKLFASQRLRAFALILFLYNLYYCERNMDMRYLPNHSDYYMTSDSEQEVALFRWVLEDYGKHEKGLEDIEPHLDSIGISADKKVISLPDPSFNITLYLMHRQGWSNFGYYNRDAEGIQRCIDKGAEFLIINEPEFFNDHDYFHEFLDHEMASHKHVRIFDLRPYKSN